MNIRNDITFCNLLSTDFEFIRNVEVLLEVDFPLVFSFNANDNKLYLAYVLNYKRRKKTLNILYVETNYQALHELLNKEISLKSVLTQSTIKTLYSHNKYDMTDFELLEVLPKDNFFLTELLPNKIDIVYQRYKVKKQLDMSKKYINGLFEFDSLLKKYLGMDFKSEIKRNMKVVETFNEIDTSISVNPITTKLNYLNIVNNRFSEYYHSLDEVTENRSSWEALQVEN